MKQLTHFSDVPIHLQRLTVSVYFGWIVTCIVFFILGLAIGKLSTSRFESAVQVQSTRSDKPTPGQTTEERLAQTAAATAQCTVLVTVLSNATEANQVVADLRRKGFTSAYITLPAEGASNPVYTVKVGFYNLPTANQVAEELQRDLGFKNARVITNN